MYLVHHIYAKSIINYNIDIKYNIMLIFTQCVHVAVCDALAVNAEYCAIKSPSVMKAWIIMMMKKTVVCYT